MSEFKGDKRTKAYKEWKEKHSKASKGVGDTVQKITKATGIETAVKFVAGEDCGCDERKTKLNQLFPYQKPECFTEQEYNYIADVIETKKNVFTAQDQKEMQNIYERIFKQKVNCTPCSFKSTIYEKLKNLYNAYN